VKLSAGVVAVVLAVLVAPWALPASAASPKPYVAVSTGTAAPGTVLGVRGAHWPQGTYLHAAICGQDAIDGSADCALAAGITVTPGPDGRVQGSMEVVLPPTPCPCVLFVTDRTSTFSTRIPLDIVGAPTQPVVSSAPAPEQPRLEVEARVVGGSNAWSLLGGPVRRTLRLTLHNTGEVPINPVISTRWGRGDNRRRILNAPAQELLAPGETRTVDLEWDIGSPAYGSYEVAGEVVGAGAPVRFSAGTTTWPWLLLFLVAQLLLFVVRGMIRRHLARRERRRRRSDRRRERGRIRGELAPEPILVDR
jgi:hypothetical protein